MNIVGRRQKLLEKVDVVMKLALATANDCMEFLLKRKDILVLDQFKDILVEVVEGSNGVSENNPHDY